eukprot:GHVO01013268.1.p1 GENE.GHVO01013268.1~~GHVO01013268.1.p1  ORF type:complete len:321 (-),score=63.49 GHVO01013268.1:195-1157(-)
MRTAEDLFGGRFYTLAHHQQKMTNMSAGLPSPISSIRLMFDLPPIPCAAEDVGGEIRILKDQVGHALMFGLKDEILYWISTLISHAYQKQYYQCVTEVFIYLLSVDDRQAHNAQCTNNESIDAIEGWIDPHILQSSGLTGIDLVNALGPLIFEGSIWEAILGHKAGGIETDIRANLGPEKSQLFDTIAGRLAEIAASNALLNVWGKDDRMNRAASGFSTWQPSSPLKNEPGDTSIFGSEMSQIFSYDDNPIPSANNAEEYPDDRRDEFLHNFVNENVIPFINNRVHSTKSQLFKTSLYTDTGSTPPAKRTVPSSVACDIF